MHPRLPISRTVGWWLNIAHHLIALCVLLCLATLMAASGPHLVHHLDDLDAGHSHPPLPTSQSANCLVLSLMQHTPLAGDFLASLPASLPTADQVIGEPRLHTVGATRSTSKARSPPNLIPFPGC
jgi:hypothetical protein